MVTEVFFRVSRRDFAYPEAIEMATHLSKTQKVILVTIDSPHSQYVYDRLKDEVKVITEKEFGKRDYNLAILDWDYPLGRYFEGVEIVIVANPDPVKLQHLKYRLRNSNVSIYVVRPF